MWAGLVGTLTNKELVEALQIQIRSVKFNMYDHSLIDQNFTDYQQGRIDAYDQLLTFLIYLQNGAKQCLSDSERELFKDLL